MHKTNKSRMLKTAGGVIGLLQIAGIQSATPGTANEKPNIILIYCDDLDFDEVSFYLCPLLTLNKHIFSNFVITLF
jgi:hypothetical protein